MSDNLEAKNLSRRKFSLLGATIVAGSALSGISTAGVASASQGKDDYWSSNKKEEEKKKKMVLETYPLPGGRFFPESIGYEASTRNFFVGSLESGQVVRGNVKTGKVETFVEAGSNGVTSAAGIKVDHLGRLYVAAAYNAKIFIYEAASARLLASLPVSASPTVVNDFVTLANGEVYVTDSLNPYLYKITPDGAGNFILDEKWLLLSGTPIIYADGLNLNGITVSADQKYLIVGQTNLGKIYRITLATKEVKEINLGGDSLVHADGILLEGRRLYVALNAINTIATVELSEDFLRGRIVERTTDPAFQFPTALARSGDRLLVVNGQLDKEGAGGVPVLPFNVVAIRLPHDK